jgi:hypothetical protein
MLWDRIFNTYQPETEKVTYGLTTGFNSNRPLVLVFHGFRQWFRKDSPKLETVIQDHGFESLSKH